MSFNNGDFVKIEYTARRASDKSIVYTTVEKVAKEEGVYESNVNYRPQLVIVGMKSTIKGVEDTVKAMETGESKKVEFGPSEAFGERNEQLVNVMRMSDFRDKGVNPYPGMQLNIDGNVATVKSINSGRVVVDLNHPLAGERLLYEIQVVGKVSGDAEKIKALAEHYSVVPDSVSVDSGVAKVVFGGKVDKNTDYIVNKGALLESVFKYLEGVRKIVVVEEFERAKDAPAEK